MIELSLVWVIKRALSRCIDDLTEERDDMIHHAAIDGEALPSDDPDLQWIDGEIDLYQHALDQLSAESRPD